MNDPLRELEHLSKLASADPTKRFSDLYRLVSHWKLLALAGERVKIVSLRLLSPAQPARLKKALEGVKRVLVVEQNHSGQLLRYLRSEYELPGEVKSLRRPGPLPFRPEEIRRAL